MLTVITGPMHSGKSSSLISMGLAHKIAGDDVVAFKPKNDNRYCEDSIASHCGGRYKAAPIDITNVIGECYAEIAKHKNIDVFLFDEAQFFDRNQLISTVRDFMTWSHVIVAGLAQDSSGMPFGAMPDLLSMADNITCLKAVCSKCKKINSATRTYRKTKNTNQIAVGGIDMYSPRCFECWMGKKIKLEHL